MALSVEDIILVILYSMVVLFGTVGNILVIRWFVKKEERKKAGNKLVVVLAINDFAASIFVPLLLIHLIITDSTKPQHAWYLGKVMCRSLLALQLTFLIATPWLLVAISVERYR